MREIIPSQLWLGNAMDVRDLRRILDLGISAIVDLALEESVPQITREIIYCRFPIVDGSVTLPNYCQPPSKQRRQSSAIAFQ